MPPQQRQTVDVAVIGGGVIGLSVAWAALRRGLRVVVLERDAAPGAGASHVAAGMLAPTSEAGRGEGALLELGLASAAGYADWCEELARASGGMDPGLRRCGALMVARDRDEAEALERELRFREASGLAVTRLRPTEARRREPALTSALRLALEAPDDHAVDPRSLLAALAAAVRRAGGELREGVERVAVAPGEGVALASGELVAAERVVVAAGAWSAGLPGVPEFARVPIRPVKGQILRLRDPRGPGLLERILRMPDAYLVPRGDGRYVLGATVEELGWDRSPTAGGAFELLRAAREILPGSEKWVIEELAAGLRPGTPDNAPVLGTGAVDGLLWATGHHRNGILLAPITGEVLAAALTGEEVPELAVPFSPGRFAPVVA
ncbi:MAG: glycine oxidase [Solirubrobacteraceae bacterium]|nr:glycine oxidase [Solirubrobacteraceae bacterium]